MLCAQSEKSHTHRSESPPVRLSVRLFSMTYHQSQDYDPGDAMGDWRESDTHRSIQCMLNEWYMHVVGIMSA